MTDGEVRVLEAGDNGTHPDAAADRRARADRADRGRPRSAPVRRRAAAVASRDRRPRRHGPGNGGRPAGRPRGLAPRSRHPARAVRRPGGARHRARGRRADRTLRGGGRGPAVAGVPGDARDRRVPAAGDALGDRAHPWRRLRLHRPDAAAPPADRRARPVRRARPAVPVRHRLRLPRTLRTDEPRRAAAARGRGGGPPGRGGRRGAPGGANRGDRASRTAPDAPGEPDPQA